jgi:hypothetical protein
LVVDGSDHRNHTVLARRLQDYMRWRNAGAGGAGAGRVAMSGLAW